MSRLGLSLGRGVEDVGIAVEHRDHAVRPAVRPAEVCDIGPEVLRRPAALAGIDEHQVTDITGGGVVGGRAREEQYPGDQGEGRGGSPAPLTSGL